MLFSAAIQAIFLKQVCHHEQINHFSNPPKIWALLRHWHRRVFFVVCGDCRDRPVDRQQQLTSLDGHGADVRGREANA